MAAASPSMQSLEDRSHPRTLLSRLGEQRSHGLFCDVTVVVEDVKFRAHGNILAACSGYFRNALTSPEAWSSGQVLELRDLKSEVFASILDFIYCSEVTSPGPEPPGGLVAAGKRLGIPFLEKLAEQQAGRVGSTDRRAPEAIARGPRITNAFSITEVCPGNHQFTPPVQTRERLPPTDPSPSRLSEHSYAVSRSAGGADSKPKLLDGNAGPLKKRHRLRGTLCLGILPAAAGTPTDKLTLAAPAAAASPPPPLTSEAEAGVGSPDDALTERGPPTLSRHSEDSISIDGCDLCPEVFTNRALLGVHAEVHNKRFVSHLFCKFCHRKFIHLKRLRHHEQACPRAARGAPGISSREAELHAGGAPDTAELSTPYAPGPLPPERPHAERPARRYGCSVCQRVYRTVSSLKRHENVHSWRRAYPCHYCNKVFALAEYRTKHEVWHTGERRYQCIFCLETVMTYYILKNHQKSFHGIDPGLAVKKKSASVYPIKLYRLLPTTFRKRRYKTYRQTYAEEEEPAFPLTFMATTKTVAPVVPRIGFGKPDVDGSPTRGVDIQRGSRAEDRVSVQAEAPGGLPGLRDSAHIGHVPFLNSLSAVQRFGEFSASAKRVEDMTTETLQSGADGPGRDTKMGAKTETYIAKPACPGPSVAGGAMPLCQITVKMGNEAVVRRRIKGSKLFPRKKRRLRELSEEESPPAREESESPRLRQEVPSATETETLDEPDCDAADKLWRPYYSYKAKKKRKKLRFKHGKLLFQVHPEPPPAEGRLDRGARLTDESPSGGGEARRRETSSPRTPYSCDICDSAFITETGLRAHVIGSHPCFCRTCGKQGPPGEAPTGGDYVCDRCMENGSCFDNAARSPNPEKKYRCSFCPQRFLYLATKRSHEQKHRGAAEEGYESDDSARRREDDIKAEDGGGVIKRERLEEGRGPIGCSIGPKAEDTTDFTSSSNFKGPLSPLFPPTTPKMKHKMSQRDAQPPPLTAGDADGNQAVESGSRTAGPEGLEKSCRPFRRTDPDSQGTHASGRKPEEWMCKEEPLF